MSNKYQYLLSPIKVGNVMFKNRLVATASKPYLVQGPESYPSDGIIAHYANKAKGGAALIVCSGAGFPKDKKHGDLPRAENLLKMRAAHPNDFNPDRGWAFEYDRGREDIFDLLNGHCMNNITMMTETVHFYGSKCVMNLNVDPPVGYDVSSGIPSLGAYTRGSGAPPLGKEIPEDMMEKVADQAVLQSSLLKEVGFDGVYIHMAYRLRILGRFLSPLTNKRTDQYGGSLENRARFPIIVADRIRQKCGKDFLIMVSMSGCEPAGGFTLDDAIEYARMFAGHIDLLQIKGPEVDVAHVPSLNPERTPFLYMAEAIKKSDPGIAVIANGGFQDLDICEEAIAYGKADFIGSARAWISNPDFGHLAYEGRGEDVVPCLRCNGCHIFGYYKPWTNYSAVNPKYGLENRIKGMIDPPVKKKKVAVIGGGPAGMEAALVASKRGHQVTVYEKSDTLGGLLKTAENVSFKWLIKDFKDYLIYQINKSNVKVCLNTEVTPDMLKEKEFDSVLVAIGAEPDCTGIPGADGRNVVFATDVYGKEDTLKENVVVIGGGEVGVETGMHLAEKGHNVTVLEMMNMLARDAPPLHYNFLKEAWEQQKNFKSIVKARCNGITADKVTYMDADGKEQTIKAGSVVIAAGMKPKDDMAMKFYGVADRVFMIGDCLSAGDIQRAMRSAFSTASML